MWNGHPEATEQHPMFAGSRRRYGNSSFSFEAPDVIAPTLSQSALDPPAALHPEASPFATTTRQRILIVDDSGLMRGMLSKLLAGGGYTDVLFADTGAEAFRLLGLGGEQAGETVDVILMDFMLPDTDGIAAVRAIKAHAPLHDVPILMVTADKEASTLRTAFEAGAIDYITKPPDATQLLARVGSALRLKREIDQRVARERELVEVTRQLERANLALERLSLTDGLTGVANRRHFDQTLGEELSRAARIGSPLALLLLDIDFFKRFNDTYGHQEGDRCLQRVAGTLGRCASRSGDLAARYGGEEFAIILPNTDPAGARSVAERLQAEVAALAIPHSASTVAATVTLSIGVAVALPPVDTDPQSLVVRADQALYIAKAQGRNRLAVAA